jgi:hypothetical protein
MTPAAPEAARQSRARPRSRDDVAVGDHRDRHRRDFTARDRRSSRRVPCRTAARVRPWTVTAFRRRPIRRAPRAPARRCELASSQPRRIFTVTGDLDTAPRTARLEQADGVVELASSAPSPRPWPPTTFLAGQPMFTSIDRRARLRPRPGAASAIHGAASRPASWTMCRSTPERLPRAAVASPDRRGPARRAATISETTEAGAAAARPCGGTRTSVTPDRGASRQSGAVPAASAFASSRRSALK